MVPRGNGSVLSGIDRCLVVLGQYKAVLVGTWLDLVSRGRHWLLLGGTGSVYCGTGWYLVVLSQNRAVLVSSVICFQKIYGLHGVNHQIIQYSEKEEVMTYRQTNR